MRKYSSMALTVICEITMMLWLILVFILGFIFWFIPICIWHFIEIRLRRNNTEKHWETCDNIVADTNSVVDNAGASLSKLFKKMDHANCEN